MNENNIYDLYQNITQLIYILYQNKKEIPDIRNITDKGEREKAFKCLSELEDKLLEASEKIDELKEGFKYSNMNDEILKLNNQISGWIHVLNMSQEEMPDVRDIKDEDEKANALDYLLKVEENLSEAVENISYLMNGFKYE